jgi:hypothetical protein
VAKKPVPKLSAATLKLYAEAFNKVVASKGGKARAQALTAAERRKIAQKGARARWGKAKG